MYHAAPHHAVADHGGGVTHRAASQRPSNPARQPPLHLVGQLGDGELGGLAEDEQHAVAGGAHHRAQRRGLRATVVELAHQPCLRGLVAQRAQPHDEGAHAQYVIGVAPGGGADVVLWAVPGQAQRLLRGKRRRGCGQVPRALADGHVGGGDPPRARQQRRRDRRPHGNLRAEEAGPHVLWQTSPTRHAHPGSKIADQLHTENCSVKRLLGGLHSDSADEGAHGGH